MVASANIAKYVKHDAVLGAAQITELEQLVEQNPWCSAYRILLAKAYYKAELPQHESKLQLASLYIGNREVLYELIHEAVPFGQESQVKERVVQADITTGPHEAVETEKPVHKTTVDFEELITYDPIEELVPEHRVIQETQDVLFEQVVYNPEIELQKIAEEQDEQEHDFMYWLNHVDQDSEQEKAAETKGSVSEVSNLLARFLESKKRQPREKRSFYKPEEKALQSETDDSEVVSETLAAIYVKQEYYHKALDAYRKLSLQNPNKSAYFAARIKEIEHKLHTKEE